MISIYYLAIIQRVYLVSSNLIKVQMLLLLVWLIFHLDTLSSNLLKSKSKVFSNLCFMHNLSKWFKLNTMEMHIAIQKVGSICVILINLSSVSISEKWLLLSNWNVLMDNQLILLLLFSSNQSELWRKTVSFLLHWQTIRSKWCLVIGSMPNKFKL